MDIAIACAICLMGGIVAGLIGVGGGIVFVPAMTLVLSKGQVEAEATSLMMIALVSVVGAWRQYGYGNVNMRDAVVIGLLSPVGVLVGVVVANSVPERTLRIGFAMLALYMAWRLLRRVFGNDPHDPAEPGTEPLADPGPDPPKGAGPEPLTGSGPAR